MAIHALIVDQTSGVRSFFARVLRSVGCATHEAADGGEAVEVLQSTSIDIAVVEAEAALLSGLDLLRLVRDSSVYANLPVVIVTSGTDQATLSEMVKLGAADCLTKPFDVELVKTRLQRIIKSISAAGSLHAVPGAEHGLSGSALVVDVDAEFRQFVALSLGDTYAVTQMASGLEALRACQVRGFTVLVMGTDTGLLSPRLLARRLRRQATLENMRIVIAPPRGTVVSDPAAFDAVVPCSFVADEFAQQFRQLVFRQRSSDTGPADSVRANVVAATEQALGMLAGIDVAVLDADDRSPLGSLEASVVIVIEEQQTAIRMAIRADERVARGIAERMESAPGVDAPADNGLAKLGEVLTVIASRVRSQMGSEGRPVTATTPDLRTVPADADTGGTPVIVRFATPDRTLAFAVCLTITEAEQPAALAS